MSGRRARREPPWRSLAAFWLVAGTMHFVRPRFYDAIMPRALRRWARPITYASGVAELAGGAAVLHPHTRGLARWWLLATLAAVYPANVEMVLRPERFPQIPRWALCARLPLQFLAAWHAWRGTAR
ncbi:MAG TPA: hypothetical protein VFR97_10105 [Capillimicrobium sp.]|nr:hypothetical protein [Capillimicrobium sp.]